MTRHDLSKALRDADLVHDEATLRAAIARVGAEITRVLAGQPAVFLTVMQGALPFAGELATRIDAPLEFDYVHATRFRGGTEGGQLEWLRHPGVPLAGRTVLLVDDILDEGHTLKAIRCRARVARRALREAPWSHRAGTALGFLWSRRAGSLRIRLRHGFP